MQAYSVRFFSKDLQILQQTCHVTKFFVFKYVIYFFDHLLVFLNSTKISFQHYHCSQSRSVARVKREPWSVTPVLPVTKIYSKLAPLDPLPATDLRCNFLDVLEFMCCRNSYRNSFFVNLRVMAVVLNAIFLNSTSHRVEHHILSADHRYGLFALLKSILEQFQYS